MTAPARRWPVEPLLALPGVTERDVCRALHVSGAKWRALIDRGLDDYQADRAAIRLGLYPEVVWPGWLDAAIDEIDVLFVQLELWHAREAAA